MKSTISVCIASYKRPELLRKLLESLVAQETQGFSFDIVVVDNDAGQSAAPVVEDFKQRHPIIYGVEVEQNISLARNKSLSLSTGEYIATIDDDTYADRAWLLRSYRAARLYDADVIFGHVTPVFDAGTPDYIKHCGAFTLPDPPTGSTDNYVPTTANCLFRRELVRDLTAPFDPAYGRTGGGDTEFFERLRTRSCKLVFCREARVFEYMPPEKTNWRWIFRREFRIGNRYRKVFGREPFDSPLSRVRKLLVIGRKMAELCLIPIYACGGLVNERYSARALERLRPCAFYAGFLFHVLGYQYEEYRGR